MPKKIRALIADLEKHGFVNRAGKGSHRNFTHPSVTRPVTVSGDAAKRYQEKAFKAAIEATSWKKAHTTSK